MVNKRLSIIIKISLVIMVSAKLLFSVIMFFSSSLLHTLKSFSIFTVPYVFARSYDAPKNELRLMVILLLAVIVGWLVTLITVIIARKKVIAVCILGGVLSVADVVSVVMSMSALFTVDKAVAIMYNLFFICLFIAYLVLKRKET